MQNVQIRTKNFIGVWPVFVEFQRSTTGAKALLLPFPGCYPKN
jgi:hypothetical protein